jgi:site-specific DNA recombinase
MSRVAIYCRVSSDEQRERQSIQTQIEECRAYAAAKGLTVVDQYLDDGYKGTVPVEDRPGSARLMRDAAAGLFHTVIVFKIDRLARQQSILHLLYERFVSLKIGIVGIKDGIDTTTKAGDLSFQFASLIAAVEREAITDRARAGIERAARNGRTGGNVPYGYRRGDDSRPVIHDGEAEIVRRLFREIHTTSTVQLAKALNVEGVPTATVTAPWKAAGVNKLLRNTAYKGKFTWGKRLRNGKPSGRELIVSDVPAIVSEQEWEAAQAAISRRFLPYPPEGQRHYLLRGLVKCGYCGLGYIGCYNNAAKQPYYRCASLSYHRDGATVELCLSRQLPGGWLEGLVLTEVSEWILVEGQFESMVHRLIEASSDTSWQQTLVQLEEKRLSLREEKDRILHLFRRGTIDEATLDQHLAEIEAGVKANEEAIVDLQRRHAISLNAEAVEQKAVERVNQFRYELKKDRLSEDTRKAIISAFVEKVVVRIPKRGKRPLEIPHQSAVLPGEPEPPLEDNSLFILYKIATVEFIQDFTTIR